MQGTFREGPRIELFGRGFDLLRFLRPLAERPPVSSEIRYLVLGLGNPGEEYADTRHNVGFMVADRLADDLGVSLSETSLSSVWGEGKTGGIGFILAKPLTFMNRSGIAAKKLLSHFGLEPRNLVAVYDDIDLEFGKIRVRTKGGSGGHLGVASIIEELRTEEFPRVRIGIGRPSGRKEVAEYVLEPFPSSQLEEVAVVVSRAAEAVAYLIAHGVEAAMREYNR